MSIADIAFRERLTTLGSEDFFMRYAGKTNKPLVDLWVIAVNAAAKNGISIDEAVLMFMDGYNSYTHSVAPWAVIMGDAISGISSESIDVVWMLRTAGAAFAAYGVEPKFKTN